MATSPWTGVAQSAKGKAGKMAIRREQQEDATGNLHQTSASRSLLRLGVVRGRALNPMFGNILVGGSIGKPSKYCLGAAMTSWRNPLLYLKSLNSVKSRKEAETWNNIRRSEQG